jgi:WD40 repeat protein
MRCLVFCTIPGWLATGGDDGRVCLWNYLRADRQPLVLDAHAGPILNIACTGQWLIAGTKDGAVILWDLRRCLLIKQSCDELGNTPRDATMGAKIQA